MTQPSPACADPRGCHAVVACVSPCGTDLLAEVDRQVRAREAEHRAAVLREVAVMFEAEVDDCPAVAGCPPCDVRSAFAARLRRMAEEARS